MGPSPAFAYWVEEYKYYQCTRKSTDKFNDMNTVLLPFKHPYTMVVCGPTQSGKTGFVLKLIDNSSTVIQPAPVKIVYCFSEYQHETFDPYRKRVQFRKGLPPTENFDGLVPTLLILDDLMAEADQSVVDLFTKVSHHRNLSVVFIVQNLFQRSPHARTISLNSHYMVLYKNPRDIGQFSILARQMYGKRASFAIDAYRQATDKPHTYLLVDLRPETDENYRLRTNVFPGEQCCVYVDERLYKPSV